MKSQSFAPVFHLAGAAPERPQGGSTELMQTSEEELRGFSYLCRHRRSSPSPRWSASVRRRGRSWAPGPPAGGCGRWSAPGTSRDARWAAPTAPPSGLEEEQQSGAEGQPRPRLAGWEAAGDEELGGGVGWERGRGFSPVLTDISVLHPAAKSWSTTVSSQPPESCRERE